MVRLICFNNFFDQIDIILVDCPPGFLQKKSRYPAFPLLKKFFHKILLLCLMITTGAMNRNFLIVGFWKILNFVPVN